MHSKSVITYSTVRKTWSASLSKVAVGLSLVLLSVMLLSMLGSFFLSGYLIDQRSMMLVNHKEVTWSYQDALRVNSHLKSNIYELSQEIDIKDSLLENSEVVSYILKQDKANDIFTKQLVNYEPLMPSVKDKMEEIFDDVSQRLLVLYHLPSGKPLVDATYFSSAFGPRRHPITNRFQTHHGVDIPLRIGDKVITTSDGTISFVGRKVGYGVTVIVDHRFGFSTTYAHLNRILVDKGDIVKKGQVIAEGGNSGISTGPHLHYEINYVGRSINPYHFYNWNLANFNSIFSKHNNIKWQQITEALQTEERGKEGLSSLRALN